MTSMLTMEHFWYVVAAVITVAGFYFWLRFCAEQDWLDRNRRESVTPYPAETTDQIRARLVLWRDPIAGRSFSEPAAKGIDHETYAHSRHERSGKGR